MPDVFQEKECSDAEAGDKRGNSEARTDFPSSAETGNTACNCNGTVRDRHVRRRAEDVHRVCRDFLSGDFDFELPRVWSFDIEFASA